LFFNSRGNGCYDLVNIRYNCLDLIAAATVFWFALISTAADDTWLDLAAVFSAPDCIWLEIAANWFDESSTLSTPLLMSVIILRRFPAISFKNVPEYLFHLFDRHPWF
jgi:hypothetical protein